jgi:hypothetical protein
VADPVVAVVKQVLVVDDLWRPVDLVEQNLDLRDPDHFGFDAQVFIGEAHRDGVDSFDLIVCSPSWLAARVSEGYWTPEGRWEDDDPVRPGSRYWFMRRWDQTEFLKAVAAVCVAASAGPDWKTVAARIGRLIPWEFDYQYDEELNRQAGLPPPPGSR